jgi:SagB-type dehydrogenase family enzyme
MTEQLDAVREYHERSKHHFGRFARGPGRLDWATQPDPFRRYVGAPVIPLEHVPLEEGPGYEAAFSPGHLPPQPLTRRSVSQLLLDSLAISAWKQAGDVRWALRVNPSSGNLHPTEGYLLSGPVPGLSETPLVAHYAPREHALEVRARVPAETWGALVAVLPPDTLLVGLSSIHWREAWKYGERAFRYCQLDVGHAVAAISLAAAGLGWATALLDAPSSAQIAHLLGITDRQGAEAEHPDCLLAVFPGGRAYPVHFAPPDPVLEAFAALPWQGMPNRLSPRHVGWSAIDQVAAATEKPPADQDQPAGTPPAEAGPPGSGFATRPPGPLLRTILHQRRSAVAMDGRGTLGRNAFYRILSRTVPAPGQPPGQLALAALPWPPQVHLVLTVHRIEGLAPGLYLLVRNPAHEEALRTALRGQFEWAHPPGCPPGVVFYRLLAGDAQAAAQQLSCRQAIASDGCFSLGMLAVFAPALERFGPWFYRRLFWECGLIGQVLYLEAEVAGVRGTGIGCFFDDGVHELLGLESAAFQSLYHFTVGHPVDDPRLTTLPAYPAPA